MRIPYGDNAGYLYAPHTDHSWYNFLPCDFHHRLVRSYRYAGSHILSDHTSSLTQNHHPPSTHHDVMSGRKTDTTTMVTLPSGASYPAYLEPLTENEKKLLDAYDAVRVYEREASRLKAEEAKRRLDEADERYRAKVAERERVEGGSKNHEDKNEVIDVAKNNRSRPYESEGADDNNIDDEDDEVVDTVAIERRKQREIEISRLQKEVDEANLAKDRREAEKMEAQKKEEFMRRELLGDVTAMEEAGGTKKRSRPSSSVDDEGWVERHDDDDDDDDDEEGGRSPPKTNSCLVWARP